MNIQKIKQLRLKTGAGIADCKKALEEAKDDIKVAEEHLKKKGFEKAAKKKDRTTAQGLITSYIHQGGKIGVLVETACETDFVARTDEFQQLTSEIAMQIAAMNPKDVKELLKQEYIRDNSVSIDDLIKQAIAKLGENIKVSRFQRLELGK